MLLTVSTTHAPARDLGFLLHKHPDRVQEFSVSSGTATVFYPEASDERCTAALLLEIDPLRLARGRRKGSPDFSLGQYVNDRPYAASSMLGVALGRVFATARAGRCEGHQQLADTAIPLQITVPVLPCRGGPSVAHRVFAPLGWSIAAEPIALDDAFPAWGDSRYVRLRLSGEMRLADALNQLFVLLPALDEFKHYWQGPDEVDKLLRSGTGWLAAHPDRELITQRYLGRHRELTDVALERLAEVGDDPDPQASPGEEDEEEDKDALRPQRRTPLSTQRHDAVLQVLREHGATSVIDLGCGPGHFLQRLLRTPGLDRIAGCDVSTRSLQQAARRLHLDDLSERQSGRIELFQAALTYEDERLAGYDAAVAMEVIEHVDPGRLDAVARVVLGAAAPRTVVVTTPNAEYNVRYDNLLGHGLRHPDHRFEWNRAQFAAWSDQVAGTYGYAVERRGVGEQDAVLGTPTQLAVFTRTGSDHD